MRWRTTNPLSRCFALLGVCYLATISCGGSSVTAPTDPTNCSPASGSVTVKPGNVLRITFAVPAGQNPDLLIVITGFAEASSENQATFHLYDGSKLLGTQSSESDWDPFWRSASSPYARGAVVDFTGIVNGTIDGRLDMGISRGDHKFDLSQARIQLGRGIDASGFHGFATGTVKSVSVCR